MTASSFDACNALQYNEAVFAFAKGGIGAAAAGDVPAAGVTPAVARAGASVALEGVSLTIAARDAAAQARADPQREDRPGIFRTRAAPVL